MDNFQLRIAPFDSLTPAELYEMLKARFNVFYLEQQCMYPDLDDIDYHAIHLALFRNRQVIAYARLFFDAATSEWRIGRMLTTERGKGLGKYLMRQALDEAKRQGADSVHIDAQTHAITFYRQLGFRVTSDTFIEAGIPHVKMLREL